MIAYLAQNSWSIEGFPEAKIKETSSFQVVASVTGIQENLVSLSLTYSLSHPASQCGHLSLLFRVQRQPGLEEWYASLEDATTSTSTSTQVPL